MPTIDICATHHKLDTKFQRLLFVCTDRSLKLVSHDQVTSQQFNSKHMLSCAI